MSRFLAIAAVCLAAPAVLAEGTGGTHTHKGLFLRALGGVGYLHANADYNPGAATADGTAGFLGLAIGGALAENLVLYGEIFGMSAANPSVQIGPFIGTDKNSSLNFGGLGVGLGTFFMPSNVFLGFAVDATRLGLTNNDGSQTNGSPGLSLSATLGKQWWISDQGGLGVSVQVIGGGNRDNSNSNNPATYKTYSGLVALTLTYG